MMGRKQKRGSKAKGKHPGIQHKEAFQRMNYLFQAAIAALSVTPSQPQLSMFYIHTMKTISKRLVLKMDPSIKRLLCKSCDSLLISGVTCTHRMKSRREKHVVVKCLTCGTLKRFLSCNEHQLWSEKVSVISNSYSGTQSLSEPQRAEENQPAAETEHLEDE